MHKIFFVFLLISASIFSSCSKKKVVVPDTVINSEKMIDILTDIEIAEAAAAHNINKGDTINYSAAYLKFIFDKNKVKSTDFQMSMDWYAAHPEMLRKIYEEVVNDLSKKQSEVAN